jgi:hypothetical protein
MPYMSDADGRSLGTIRRVAPKRPFRHTWRIDHPGRGGITGRGEWFDRRLAFAFALIGDF